MQAVILAAGRSQRFYPLTAYAHKSMVRMMGKPLLQHTLEALHKARFTEVVIVVSEKSTIPQEITDIPGLSIRYIVQKEALGMGHALLAAEQELDKTFFLLSGYHMDIADFSSLMLQKQRTKDEVVLLAKEDTLLERYGVLKVKGDSVLSVSEKPEAKASTGLRVIGVYLLNATFLETLKTIPVEQYHFEKALDVYAKTNKVTFVQTEKPSLTLKHSWDLLSVKDYLLSRITRAVSKNADIAKNAVLEGEIVISDGVKILEGACIKGPCYLGKNVIVGNNAILRNGVIAEDNVVIGATMEVKNSVLMEGVTTHTGFIGDSVVGSHSRLAAGFCSANVRFDRGQIMAKVRGVLVNTYRSHFGTVIGEHVNTGINVATMPGVSVGNNTTIGPGTMIMENVEENSLIFTKFQTVIKKKKHE